MFIAVLFVTAPTWELHKLPINGRICKSYIHTTKYQSTEHEQFTVNMKLSVNFTNIKLNKISQIQKRTYFIFLFIIISNTGKSNLYVW